MSDPLLKNELIKHTAIIQSDNRELNLIDKKISNVLLKNAFERLDVSDLHSMKFMDIAQMIGWGSDYSYTDILTSIKKLTDVKITWNILGIDEVNDWTQSSLLASYKVKKDAGIIEYGYSPHFRKLLKHPSIYARLDILIQSTINKKHSLNLWELLKSQIQSGKAILANNNTYISEIFELSAFKSIVGVKDKFAYKEFKYFKRDILVPAVEEVNEKTDIYINDTVICKEGRNITGLKFEFKAKEAVELKHNIYSKEHDQVRKTLLEYNLSNKIIDSFFTEHTIEIIQESILAALVYISTDKSKKRFITPALITSAIRNEWKAPVIEATVKNRPKQQIPTEPSQEDLEFTKYEELFKTESPEIKTKYKDKCLKDIKNFSSIGEHLQFYAMVDMYYRDHSKKINN